MSADDPFLEIEVADGVRLRVTFIKLADRYGHRLSVVMRGESGRETLTPLAESVEGAPDDPWPPSPPLQSLSIERLADGRTAALLVGMAGRSHWSASIAAKPDESLKCFFEFDIACRCAETTGLASSEYRVMPGIKVDWDPQSCSVRLHAPEYFVAMKALHGCQPSDVRSSGDARFWFAAAIDQTPVAGTLRWRYAVCLSRGVRSD